MKKTSNLDEFAQAGIAALLPGMRYMVELMTAARGDKQTLLALLQDGAHKAQAPHVGPCVFCYDRAAGPAIPSHARRMKRMAKSRRRRRRRSTTT